MKIPVLIINLKAYKESSGDDALRIALAAEKAVRDTGKSVAVAVQAIDLRLIASKVKIPVFVQHVDAVGYGAFTGHIVPFAAKEAGAAGALINHSEFQVPVSRMQETINKCREAGLVCVVCAPDSFKAEKFAVMYPDFVAVEPPELIGGKVSVSTARPEIIAETVRVLGRIGTPVICGAGIHTAEDVKIGRKLGAEGFLVASGVVKAKDAYSEIMELLKFM